MREFNTGATRDEDKTKPDPEGYYHPLVVQEFCRYMTKHRIQADGEPRDSDNWQQLFGTPEEHRRVCIKSMWRHFLDLWLFHRDCNGRESIKEALCGLIFNAQAYLFSLLLDEIDQPDKAEEPGAPQCAECGGTAKTGHQTNCSGGIVPMTDRDGLPCAVCGGDNASGHQQSCPILIEEKAND